MATRLSTFDVARREASHPVPVSGWRRALSDSLTVGGATTVCHALGAVTSLLLRMMLDPADMGIWQGVKLFLGYGNYTNLGISKGAVREYNVALGRGNPRSAVSGLNLAFTINTISSLTYAAILIGVGIWIGTSRATWPAGWSAGLVVVGVLAALSRYITFHVTILRTHQAFNTTSRLSILEALLALIVCVPAAWCWGLWGIYLGTLSATVATIPFILRHRKVSLRWHWDLSQSRRLIAIGGPILLAGTVSTLFRSLDKLMILGYLGDREFQLGCYSLALMVTTQLYGLGNILSIVMGPRYGEKFGQSANRADVARLAARASELQAAAIVLPAALAMIVAPPLLGSLLPDYRSGLVPLVWLIPGAIALTLALPATQYLVAVDRQRRALAVVILATLLAVAGNHVALRSGSGLVGVGIATATAYVVYWILAVAVSIWPELGSGDRLRYSAMSFGILLPSLTTAAVCQQAFPNVPLLLKIVVVLMIWSSTVALGWRFGGWKLALRTRHGDSHGDSR